MSGHEELERLGSNLGRSTTSWKSIVAGVGAEELLGVVVDAVVVEGACVSAAGGPEADEAAVVVAGASVADVVGGGGALQSPGGRVGASEAESSEDVDDDAAGSSFTFVVPMTCAANLGVLADGAEGAEGSKRSPEVADWVAIQLWSCLTLRRGGGLGLP